MLCSIGKKYIIFQVGYYICYISFITKIKYYDKVFLKIYNNMGGISTVLFDRGLNKIVKRSLESISRQLEIEFTLTIDGSLRSLTVKVRVFHHLVEL